MATGKFRVKTNNNWNTIYYRFKSSKEFDVECSTTIQVPNKRWSEIKSEVLPTKGIDSSMINANLRELDLFVRNEFEVSKRDSVIINAKWLKEKINQFFNKETTNEKIDNTIFFTNYISQFIEESKTKKSRSNTTIKPRTIQHYNTTLNKIEAYQTYSGRKLKIVDIGLKFHSDFINFLEQEQKLNPNTVGGYIDDVKLICNNADKKGITINKEVRLSEFYTLSNKTKDIYLKEEEINKIYNHNLEQDYLDNARDWFIIGLRTGLRISDFLRLTNKNLVDGFIEKTTIKTDFPVIIPIHKQVQAILDKRNGKFPREISDQKFNEYIKKVCQEAGINEATEGARMDEVMITKDGKTQTIFRKKVGKYPKYELVSSHICRRSFATNLYGKIDTLTIMKITGHKTESQFLHYIKITPKQYAEKLREYWKNNPNL